MSNALSMQFFKSSCGFEVSEWWCPLTNTSFWIFGLLLITVTTLFFVFVWNVFAQKEYNGFCESCGKRLETSRYTIKLCEDCRMEEFDKSRESVSPTSQTSPNGDFSNEKEHNIS